MGRQYLWLLGAFLIANIWAARMTPLMDGDVDKGAAAGPFWGLQTSNQQTNPVSSWPCLLQELKSRWLRTFRFIIKEIKAEGDGSLRGLHLRQWHAD